MSIFLTGSSCFVGKNLIAFFSKTQRINFYKRNSLITISENIVIHLAGKADDLKKTSNIHKYYDSNTLLTRKIFDEFINSNTEVFITLSSVKAVADSPKEIITEETKANPKTYYGKSKLQAEQYILSKSLPRSKRVYILRPCMIHGQGDKGNLNLLFKLIINRVPWPLGAYSNKRSYCSIENLMFVIQELISNSKIPSGIYNVADDDPLNTKEVVQLIGEAYNFKPRIYSIPKILIKTISKIGDLFNLPLNSERLKKLTESYIVSNFKIKNIIKKPLPVYSR